MTNTRPTVPCGPVVLTGIARRRRKPIRGRDVLLGADALETPLPGRLLVLLSRLHRSEGARPESGDRDA